MTINCARNRHDGAVHGACAVEVNVFEPILRGRRARRQMIEPSVGLAGGERGLLTREQG